MMGGEEVVMGAEPRTPLPSGRFPDWTTLYAQEASESLPWFHKNLDPDLAAELDRRGLVRGAFLDLGTGPGTQARQLARRGFAVTGSDIAATAIGKARARGTGGVIFVQDDILRTKLVGPFDCIFDRGCFHVIDPAARPVYVANVKKLLRPGGLLFLKCFSDAQPDGGHGPWRFSRAELEAAFAGTLAVESVRDTVYQGTMEPQPKALFAVMTRPWR
jgi:SAM-dependent methyltransferase